PVPEAAQPFVAGPRDRPLQLPPVAEIGWAAGGARCGCDTWCVQVYLFVIWSRRNAVHRGLPWMTWPTVGLVSEGAQLSGLEISAGFTVAGVGGVHHEQPPTRWLTNQPTRIRVAAVPPTVVRRQCGSGRRFLLLLAMVPAAPRQVSRNR